VQSAKTVTRRLVGQSSAHACQCQLNDSCDGRTLFGGEQEGIPHQERRARGKSAGTFTPEQQQVTKAKTWRAQGQTPGQ